MSHSKPHSYSNKPQDKLWARRQFRRFYEDTLAVDAEIAREKAEREARAAKRREARARKIAALGTRQLAFGNGQSE